jgi:prolyl oligopeptidase
MIRWFGRLSAGLALALAPAVLPVFGAAPTPPPPAPVRPVTDVYFGTSVTDPYRWLENLSDPEVVTFFRQQNDYTRAVIGQLGAPRAKLLAQIRKLDDAGIAVYDAVRDGSSVFYMKLPKGANIARLYVRRAGGPERLLFDPERFGHTPSHYAVDYYSPSLDGRYVALGIAANGSEDDTLHVIDVRTGKMLPDAISRMTFDGVDWRSDGRSFYYTRMPKLGPHDPPTAERQKIRAYLHVLGRDPDRDPLIFGYGANRAIPFTPDETAYVMVSPDSAYAVGYIVNGVQPNVRVYATLASEATSTRARWTEVARAADDVKNVDFRGGTIYVQSYRRASRYEVLAASLAKPDLRDARTIVAAGTRVIAGIGAAADGLYVQELDGGLGRMQRVSYATGAISDVKLPYDGAISEFSTDSRLPGFIMKLGAWTRPSLIFASDGERLADTHLKPPIPVDFSAYTSIEVKAPSKDGTLVPLSIIYPKNMSLDGSHDAVLEGYGAYGEVLDPYFSATRLAWLERGGIFAFAHVRGGGEYGEDWHRAGMKLTKQHSIDDMVACAQYLVDRRYTTTPKLGIWGASAGGIVIGGFIDQRPDLIASAIDDVGSNNALRQEFSPNGPGNVPEFGSVKTPEGFKALYAMDAVAHVKDGAAYPAVLLETGINDPRVAPWESAKYAARLQAATSSGKPILLRVDYQAGHGYGTTKAQAEDQLADEWTFLLWQFGDPEFHVP